MSPNSTPSLSSSSLTLCSYHPEPDLPSTSPSPNLTDDPTGEIPTKASARTCLWGYVALAFLGLCILALGIGVGVGAQKLLDESCGKWTRDESGNWVVSGKNITKEIGGYICYILGIFLGWVGLWSFVGSICWFIQGLVQRLKGSKSNDSVPV